MYVVININNLNLFPKDEVDFTDEKNPILIKKAPFAFKVLGQRENDIFGVILGDTIAFKNSGIEHIEVIEDSQIEGFREVVTNERQHLRLEQYLPKMKELKIHDFSKNCENEIVNGFKSSVLGEPHYYQSNRDDQLNLIGVVTAGEDTIYKCSLDNQTWEYKEHTIAQLKQILSDGKAIKSSLLQKFNTLKNQILNIVSIEELEGIKW